MDKVKEMLGRTSVDGSLKRRDACGDFVAESHRKAVEEIGEKLGSIEGLTWAFIGSINLVLQGVERKVNDIDIYVDGESFERLRGAEIFDGVVFKKDVDRKVFVADVLSFVCNGVDVEIIGPMKREGGGDLWTEEGNVLDFRIELNLEGKSLWSVPLELEFRAYALNGREDKAAEMIEALGKYI